MTVKHINSQETIKVPSYIKVDSSVYEWLQVVLFGNLNKKNRLWKN